MSAVKGRQWFKPMFDKDDEPSKKHKKEDSRVEIVCNYEKKSKNLTKARICNKKNSLNTFDPVTIEDLAVHHKKINEVEDWLKPAGITSNNRMLLLSGPVGCGKTATVHILCSKHQIKISEWITPIDIEIPADNGKYEFRERQSTKFLDFLINAANYTSLLDNNVNKIVLVEDFPNTFIRTPSEFSDVLEQYKQKAKSPLVFISSDSHTDNRNTILNLFTPSLKEKFGIHHITFNSVSTTGLKAALKRIADMMSKELKADYNPPTSELIECVVNSSGGDVRSAVMNLHFAALKGSSQNLETSILNEKEKKNKSTKKKKQSTSKFSTIGKNETVSILHGVGRVLNPKIIEKSQQFSHCPQEIVDQFLSQPSSFVNFLEENYLPHFSSIDHAQKAASALSDADFLLAEWKEKMFQEYGLYSAVAGLMLANKIPVSGWNPVRGPKNMKVLYPTPHEVPLLEKTFLYKGKVLVTDYLTFCKLISLSSSRCRQEDDNFIIE